MVVVDPTLRGRKLGIRPSMKKFDCHTSNQLEIVKSSSPRKLFLNRPLITILEQMGIKCDVFVNLQKEMILSLIHSLIYEKDATHSLEYCLPSNYCYSDLQNAGLSLIAEPFFRSLLLSAFQISVDHLRSKGRIRIPEKFGRNMLGVVDETRTLEYGQVFVQYSKSTDMLSDECEILKGTVVVTKNPCMHPGDVRKLEAVDVPALRHIKDCIVFPSKGKRPHPDEMAGADLDGDEFVVIWLPELLFQRDNYRPMKYPTYEELSDDENDVYEMVDFFLRYIQNDKIGVFANAHLALADQHPKGIFSDKCMKISKKYPLVLDFAKTGQHVELEKQERAAKYPDFMEKRSKSDSYYSEKTLGVLFRIMRNLRASVDNIVVTSEVVEVDQSFCYPGWEKYAKSSETHMLAYVSEVHKTLDRFGVKCVSDALCGNISGNQYDQGRNDKANVKSIVSTSIVHIMREFRNIFWDEVSEYTENFMDLKTEVKCMYQRASAWYMVAYRNGHSKMLSFPWILSDILAEVRAEVLKSQGMCIPDVREYVMGNVMSEIFLNDVKSCTENGSADVCKCLRKGGEILRNWLKKLNLLNSGSDQNENCSQCLDRIYDYYLSSAEYSCCSANQGGCSCSESCSVLKFILSALEFYMSNIGRDLGKCKEGCNGFRVTNLQSLALQSLVNLAVTRDIKYLGVQSEGVTYTYDCCFAPSEGEVVRISVKNEDKNFLATNMEGVKKYLKSYFNVEDVFIQTEQDFNQGWFLLINSVGRNFQRWNLEDFILHPHFIKRMKQHFEKT